MILVIDNYDSFVHNLARYIREAGLPTTIVRNDATDVDACLALKPNGIVISPGPNDPSAAGISKALISAMPETLPLLGVCLGHQCLVECFGGQTIRAREPLHGMASDISHDTTGLFTGLKSPMPVGRYHSLISVLPENSLLRPVARSGVGELMAVAHRTRPWFGVQFHPESLLTRDGLSLVKNFVEICCARHD